MIEFKKLPNFWIIPSKLVAETIKSVNKKWLESPGKNNQTRKGSKFRLFRLDPIEYYPEKWNETLKEYEGNIEILNI